MKEELKPPEYRVLRRIADARAKGVKIQSIDFRNNSSHSRVVKPLKVRGYIKKYGPKRSDGTLYLTPKGKKALQEIPSSIRERVVNGRKTKKKTYPIDKRSPEFSISITNNDGFEAKEKLTLGDLDEDSAIGIIHSILSEMRQKFSEMKGKQPKDGVKVSNTKEPEA